MTVFNGLDIVSGQGRLDDNYDVCIVGGGAVGYTMAYRLKGKGLKVIVLESSVTNTRLGHEWTSPRFIDKTVANLDTGDLAPDTFVQASDRAVRRNFLTASRTRVLGGSTNCWGGFIRPLDSYDFEDWPIDRNDLDTYYKQALDLVDLSHFDLFDDLEGWNDYTTEPVTELKFSRHLKTVVIQQQQNTRVIDFQESTRFSTLFDGERGFDLVRNATALELAIVPVQNDGLITHITCGTLVDANKPGGTFKVSANKFVLAMGGLEVPRFLLNNQLTNSNIGRHYMNHPKWSNLISFNLSTPADYTDIIRTYGSPIALKNNPDYEYIYAYVVPDEKAMDTFKTENFRYAFNMRRIGTGSYQVTGEINMEQTANYASTVTRSSETDAFGQRKLRLDWQWSGQDKATFENSQKMLLDAFTAFGPTRLTHQSSWDQRDDRNLIPYTGDHHMGTVMMNSSVGKADRVVDENLKINQFRNLWACSTGVFPRGGWGNATYTLLALTLRLSDHLEKV